MTKTFDGLPEESFHTHNITGETIKIKRGESGYYQLPDAYSTADEFNEVFNVSKAQAEAMYMGSMVGWDAPASDPRVYHEDGTFNNEALLELYGIGDEGRKRKSSK